jgi:hypothetical protein
MMALTHAHWLLEAAACFQPGDVATQMIRRLQKAAAIMEELE